MKQLQSPLHAALKSGPRPIRSAGTVRISFNFSRAQVRFLLSGGQASPLVFHGHDPWSVQRRLNRNCFVETEVGDR